MTKEIPALDTLVRSYFDCTNSIQKQILFAELTAMVNIMYIKLAIANNSYICDQGLINNHPDVQTLRTEGEV